MRQGVQPQGLAREGIYAGAGIDNANRFNSVMWLALTPGIGVLLVVAPPTEHGAALGWSFGALALLFCFGSFVLLRYQSHRVSFEVILVLAYATTVQLAVLMWLAGGWSTPYDEFFLAMIVGASLTHPARRAAPFVIVAELLVLTPILYGQTDGRLAEVLFSLAIWSAVATFCVNVMNTLREQRLEQAQRGDHAIDEARRDQLTGAENRRSFDESFERQLLASRVVGRPLTLVMADIDCFKEINDRRGHLEGDAILRLVSQAMQTAARADDRIYRWGGDEFAMLLENTRHEEAAAVCDRVLGELDSRTEASGLPPVRLSFGWEQDSGVGAASALVESADAMLLLIKQGRAEQTVA